LRLPRLLGRPAARAVNDYATLVPVLVALASRFHIRSVLELGSGRFSTPTVLNRAAFPDLEHLDSLENDPDWAKTVQELVGPDPRLDLRLVDGSIGPAVAKLDVGAYDAVLIDDSTRLEDRVETIKEVAARAASSTIVLIHDYEVSEYRIASASFKNRFAFTAFTPQTGALSNGSLPGRRTLVWLNSRIKFMARRLDPGDIDGWVTLFSG
jgi:hypothetical protein